jgi:quercetin dioxygenase-like cupin family protein
VTPFESIVAPGSYDARVNNLHRTLKTLAPRDCPVTNRFTPGLYSREILMPAGTVIVSRVHKTEHQYCVLSGKVAVATPDGRTEILRAGHVGITHPGTRRVLWTLEDTRWVTFHPTTTTDLEKLQEELTETPDVGEAMRDPESMRLLDQLQADFCKPKEIQQ